MPLDIEFTCLSSDASATISLARSNMKVAPEGMIFTVNLVGFDTPSPVEPDGYNPQHHEIYYFWNFGDPDSSFASPSNVMSHQKNANTMTGPVAAHTYATPGTYTVSVLVMEPSSGKTATATLSLTGEDAVRDPNMIFLGPNTYWMDVAGNGAGAPAGALVYDNIQNALDHAWQNAKPCRLLFRDGQTWNIPTTLDVRGERAFVNVYMAGQGTGTPPVLQTADGATLFLMRNWYQGNTLDVVATGLHFQGLWDETTEIKPTSSGASMCFYSLTGASGPYPVDYLWMHDCRFNGFYSSVNTTSNCEISTALGISDCRIESWLNIGVYLNTFCPTAVIGSRIARSPNALAGGEKFDHNVHGPIRSQHCGPMVIAKNDMFTNSGWFENIFGYRTQQPCIRIFQSGEAGGLANVSQNTFEGGYPVVATSRQDPNFGLGIQNSIVDGNLMVGGHMTPFAIFAEYGGMTVRNNIYVRPDTPTIAQIFDPNAFVYVHLPTGNSIGAATPAQLAANAAAPIKIYNNTYAMLCSDANFFGGTKTATITSTAGFTALEEENNVIHAPNASAPITADANLNTTVLFAPRMRGYRSVYERITHTLSANVPNGGSFSLPYPAGRSASDYGPTTSIDPHEIETSAGRHNSNFGSAVFGFDAGGITVINASGQNWAAGEVVLVLYALNSPPDALDQFITPADAVATYAPLEGSAALGDAIQDPVSITDFYGEVRPFYPSRGAFEMDTGPA